jgi:hypothetical protein
MLILMNIFMKLECSELKNVTSNATYDKTLITLFSGDVVSTEIHGIRGSHTCWHTAE